ncbi:hypothetical protein [Thiorhodococcus drewsii]|uniref:hypothetical protein n=1 Tax=Thiorhodococcus drewsii TaxID=210408 RepID=UPI001112B9A2|nr:hypothetical protein [Thiorhodococcus drewsii]
MDESIYLVNILYLQSWFGMARNPANFAISVAIYSIKQTATAIRILEAQGLDGPARQNLRVFREQCLVMARLCVDEEFLQEFAKTSSHKAANEFWHRYISKGKTEKFLRDFKGKDIILCPLVADNYKDHLDKVVGPSIHPSIMGFEIPFRKDVLSASDDSEDSMIPRSPGSATEFVLFYASHLLLGLILFCSSDVARRGGSVELFKNNPLFGHFNDEIEAMEKIGKAAGVMWLMLPKLTNRAKPHFDSAIHW